MTEKIIKAAQFNIEVSGTPKLMKLIPWFEMQIVFDRPEIPRKEAKLLHAANLEELNACFVSQQFRTHLEQYEIAHIIALGTFYPMIDDCHDLRFKPIFKECLKGVRRVKGITYCCAGWRGGPETFEISGYDYDGFDVTGESWVQPKWNEGDPFLFLYVYTRTNCRLERTADQGLIPKHNHALK